MKQLVILSGKGGTGKTSVAAAFAHLLSLDNAPFRAVLADADVDASNLELVLSPKVISHEDFWGGQFAKINEDTCTECGICEEVCRFDAISSPVPSEKGYQVDPIACDGCAACVYQCPVEAITMHNQIAGEWFQSESRYGPLFHDLGRIRRRFSSYSSRTHCVWCTRYAPRFGNHGPFRRARYGVH